MMPKGSDRIRVSVRARGVQGPSSTGDYRACCPWCLERAGKEDTKFKLSVNPSKGLYYCYRCSTKGRTKLEWMLVATDIVREELAAGEAVAEPDLGPPEGFIPFEEGTVLPIGAEPYKKYLLGRKLFTEAVAVGAGCCINGRFGGRVIIPMREPSSGAWTGFSARTIYPGVEPKYLYPTGMRRRLNLWGMEHQLHFSPSRLAWLVEGVFDAMALFPHGLAAFGKNVTDEQLELLMQLQRPVVVCLDGDAWEEGRVIAMRLAMRGVETRYCHLPPGTDPGVLGWEVKKYIVDP